MEMDFSLDFPEENKSPDSKRVKRSNALSMHDSQDIVQLAQSVQNAHEFVKSQAFAKLSVIAEQMEFLQAQAVQVLEKARRDESLHSISCNLKKIPGKTYYLYSRQADSQRYFSMISPEEWGDLLKDEFLGAFRLESDRSWTSDEELLKQNDRQKQCSGMLLGKKSMIEFND